LEVKYTVVGVQDIRRVKGDTEVAQH